MNDGSMTSLDPATGKMSAIHLSFVALEIAYKFQWSVNEDSRGSDHFPTQRGHRDVPDGYTIELIGDFNREQIKRSRLYESEHIYYNGD